MIKPNFLVIGAPKCATTSLCGLLAQHPDVFMTAKKEINFFASDKLYELGWSWYADHFQGARHQTAIGEGGTLYSRQIEYPRAADRIARDLPGVRLIYIVRHPLDRIESDWLQLRRSGYNVPPFNLAVKEKTVLLDSSRYWHQLNRYRQHIPDKQILLLFLKDFRASPETVTSRCFEFLGVNSDLRPTDTDQPKNVSVSALMDTRLLTHVRHIPGFDALRDRLPSDLRGTLRCLFKKRITAKPRWNRYTRRWATEQLLDDTRAILEYGGKPPDYWQFD